MASKSWPPTSVNYVGCSWAKYNSALLIKHEFDVLALKKYIGRLFFFYLLGYLHILMHTCIHFDPLAQLCHLTLLFSFDVDMISGKERRKALLELARIQGAKMIGSSSSTIEPS